MTIDARLAVVIVNYGAGDYIIEHLPKTLAQCDAFADAHIYIADNASPGGDIDRLSAHIAKNNLSARVTAFSTGGNLGFAGGNNAAFAAFQGPQPDVVFFLNPDAWPEDGALARLAQTLLAHDDVGLIGPHIVDERGDTVISYFHFPTIASQFGSEVQIDVLQRRTGWKILDLNAAAEPIEMDWVSGAAFMARMAALDAPPMDDGYFLYFEETDMMRAITEKGWRILLEPRARIMHVGGLTTGAGYDARQSARPRYWYESWARYFVKHHGRLGAMAAIVSKTAGVFAYYLKALLTGQRIWRPKNYLLDFLRYATPRVFKTKRQSRDSPTKSQIRSSAR